MLILHMHNSSRKTHLLGVVVWEQFAKFFFLLVIQLVPIMNGMETFITTESLLILPFSLSSGAYEGPKPKVFRAQLGLLRDHMLSHKTGVLTLYCGQRSKHAG